VGVHVFFADIHQYLSDSSSTYIHLYRHHGQYLLTRPNYVGQRTSEPNSFADSQEGPRNLYMPKVHYSVHKIPTLIPFLSKIYPARTRYI